MTTNHTTIEFGSLGLIFVPDPATAHEKRQRFRKGDLMDLQIAMRKNGVRFVYDRDKLSSDVVDRLFDDVPYSLAFGDNCPPEAIEADGFADIKSVRAYLKKRGADAAEPAFRWKRVKARDDKTEYQLFIDDRHVATVFNEGDKTEPSWVVRDVARNTEDNGYETMADAKESAECLADD